MFAKLALLFAVFVCAIRAQEPSFEVAAVRPNRSGENRSSIARDGGRITMENVSLRECIMFAFSIPTGREYQLLGPEWMDSEKFDIGATFPAAATREQVREMTQALLAERFGLRTHREERKIKAYALVVDPKGTKLAPGDPGDDGAFSYSAGRVTIRGLSLGAFADRLSGPAFKLDRPVVDLTGRTGTFNFTVEWSPGDGVPGPSIFTALQEQLGLRLVAQDASVRILIVDGVNRVPTGN